MIKYIDGYAHVDGYKFRRDEKSGYYLSTKNIGSSRIRLHRYTWEKNHGDIPEGFEVHHKDENKYNNDINNLELLTKDKHLAWHSDNIPSELVAKWKDNLEEHARPKAIEWHKSVDGRKWHSENAKKNHQKAELKSYTCVFCGESFKSINFGNKSMFCSRSCAAAERRASGKDDIEKVCVICKEVFVSSKYRKNKSCSRKCGGELRRRNNELKAST